MKTINICHFSNVFAAYLNCCDNNRLNLEWMEKHKETIEELTDLLPSGSGIDSGIEFDFAASNRQKLVFTFEFHHMEDGYYTEWTEHKLILTPSFPFGYTMKITGRDKNDIKAYLYDLFDEYFILQPDYSKFIPA